MLCYSLSCYIMTLLYSKGVDNNMKKTRTAVNICGKEYTMAGFESEEYIHRVAISVDRKMADLKEQYVNLNPNTLSVLTAINVADDLLKLHDYLAMGKPIVSTNVGGANDLKHVIGIAQSPFEFLEQTEKALKKDTTLDILNRNKEALQNSWQNRIKDFENLLRKSLKTLS